MSLQVFETIDAWKQTHSQWRDLTVGFVPTMGALHEGHVSLIQRSQKDNDRTVVSIFVNPKQFDQVDDLVKYPRTLEKDLELLRSSRCDALLLPDDATMYPDKYRYRLQESSESAILCGASRPGHFDGVLTVVLKFLHLVQPNRAYFGEKDYQQLRLIEGMVEALFLPVEIIGCPIVRESDGLAMSSRNQRLTPEQRSMAPLLYKTLKLKLRLFEIRDSLKTMGFEIDYLEERWGRRLAAVRLGDVRLIDNVEI